MNRNTNLVPNEDEFFMIEALSEALLASECNEVPVGAVIVKDGEIIARAHNLVETNSSSGDHAEILAIRKAEKVCKSKWLTGCTLYVTLEPCFMCAGAMVLSRIDRLVFGADDPKNGACGSIYDVACNDRLNHRIEVRSGVLSDACGEILRDFFKKKRINNKAMKLERQRQLEEEN